VNTTGDSITAAFLLEFHSQSGLHEAAPDEVAALIADDNDAGRLANDNDETVVTVNPQAKHLVVSGATQ